MYCIVVSCVWIKPEPELAVFSSDCTADIYLFLHLLVACFYACERRPFFAVYILNIPANFCSGFFYLWTFITTLLNGK
jgi:hypothetical protein